MPTPNQLVPQIEQFLTTSAGVLPRSGARHASSARPVYPRDGAWASPSRDSCQFINCCGSRCSVGVSRDWGLGPVVRGQGSCPLAHAVRDVAPAFATSQRHDASPARPGSYDRIAAATKRRDGAPGPITLRIRAEPAARTVTSSADILRARRALPGMRRRNVARDRDRLLGGDIQGRRLPDTSDRSRSQRAACAVKPDPVPTRCRQYLRPRMLAERRNTSVGGSFRQGRQSKKAVQRTTSRLRRGGGSALFKHATPANRDAY